MVQLKDFIQLPVDRKVIAAALVKAINADNVGIDNLRYRPRMVRLDCKVRGYIGEVALRNWFANYNIHFDKIDYFDDDTNMDIDMVYEGHNDSYDIEVKTSLVPDAYHNMTGVIQRADIKIIKRTDSINSVSGDIHIQIYFDFLRKERDTKLRNLNQSINDPRAIYEQMELDNYINNTYFVAWIDKPSLINYINNLSYKTWTFPYAKKDFWKCPIGSIAKKPIEIINYINNL